MEQVAEAIKFFERDILSGGVSPEQANNAKYILCATADDIIQNIPNEERHLYAQYNMGFRFFGNREGGVRFFDSLTHAERDPNANYPVLELHHACLALGFQGVYRHQPGGLATLQQTQRNLYETLRRLRPKVMRELSPNWKGLALGANVLRARLPVWVVASAAAALLFGLYVTLRFLLSGDSDAVAEKIGLLHSNDPLKIFRIGPPPPLPKPPVVVNKPPPPPPLPDPCKILQTPNSMVMRCGEALFDPGQAIVKDDFKQKAADIAHYLDQFPGRIQVVGHTDNIPIKNARFPSNYDLSVERAKAVAELLMPSLHDPGRLGFEGKGQDVAIGDNKTPEGRAMNRRVEITFSRPQ
jgi:type VI secretion system protein ImpK